MASFINKSFIRLAPLDSSTFRVLLLCPLTTIVEYEITTDHEAFPANHLGCCNRQQRY